MLNNINQVYVDRFLNRKKRKLLNYLTPDDVYISIMLTGVDSRSLKGFSRFLFLLSRKPDIFISTNRKIKFLSIMFHSKLNKVFSWLLSRKMSMNLPKITLFAQPKALKEALCI